MKELLGLPIDASVQGPPIDNMIAMIHWLMLILFVGWISYFVFTLIRFRQSKHPKADYRGVRTHLSSYVEVGVALTEVVLLVGFAFPLWAKRVNQVPDEKDATVVRVVAEQFAWNVHYPGPDGIFGRTDINLVSSDNPLGLDRSDPYAKDDITTINQLNLPINKPVIVRLSSKDVIHSFNLPLFRVKQDAIPGQVVKVWFEPTTTTSDIRERMAKTFSIKDGSVPSGLANLTSLEDYRAKDGTPIVQKGGSFSEDLIPQLLQAGITDVKAAPDTPTEIACAQLCGLGHYRMRGFVTVQTPEEYAAWVKDQETQLQQVQSADTSVSGQTQR
jgi:cytochrome c oxidase subunit 2